MKLSRLRQIIIEEIIEYSDIENIKKQKITNPQTKKPITVGSALTYDTSDSVYTKAKQIVQKGKDINPSPEKSNPNPSKVVEPDEHEQKQNEIGFETQDGKGYDSEKWKKDYIRTNKQGSSIIGTLHYNADDKDTVEKSFIEKNVYPAVKDAVSQAKKMGKDIVFMGEGGDFVGNLEDEGNVESYPEGSEQEMVDKYIKKLDPTAETTTWDGKEMSRWNPYANYWDKASKKLGIPKDQLNGAMYAFVVGQGDSPEAETEYLTKAGKRFLRNVGYKGKLPPKEKSQDVKDLYNLAFPEDTGQEAGSNDVAKFQEFYNKERQKNMLKKKREYEKQGKAVIVTPGASHAYQLSDEWNK